MSPNGKPYILPDRAQALAAYPHARYANGFIFVSGISSRRLDNTYEGASGYGTFCSEIPYLGTNIGGRVLAVGYSRTD